jgi:hypothetical protein
MAKAASAARKTFMLRLSFKPFSGKLSTPIGKWDILKGDYAYEADRERAPGNS